jgi:superfamily II DNA or RNA helicase
LELRPYQKEAVDAIEHEWDSGKNRTLLVLPTGTGKTICFSEVIRRQNARGGRSLVLAHRQELLDQASDKIKRTTGLDSAVEKAESHSAGTMLPVTVGSVQTLSRDTRLSEYSPEAFNVIIIDEAHHAISESYQKVLKYFHANVLGVTATPDRGDMRNLGEYFESLAYEYSLPQAIREGYLSPIKAQTIPLNIDLTSVKIQQGDFSAGDLGNAIEPYLDQIADVIRDRYPDKKTVAFLPLVDTSKKFCEILQSKGVQAWEVNGSSADREKILKEFERAKRGVVCNAMLLTEGWDCPSVDCVVVLRPTKIRSLYAQMIGRGTRLCEGKDHLLILDFLWHTTRHELCKPASLICKKQEEAEIINKMMEDGEVVDISEETLEEAKQSAKEERERALAEMLAQQRKKRAKLVDPLQFEMSILDDDLQEYEPTFKWEMEEPTEKQIAAIEKFGINPTDVTSKGYASMLLDKLVKRSQNGYSTPKQIRLLEQKGFTRVGEWTFNEATKMIRRLAVNHWMIPYGVDPSSYLPAGLKIRWE